MPDNFSPPLYILYALSRFTPFSNWVLRRSPRNMTRDETTQSSSSILKNALDLDFRMSSSKEKQVLSEPCSPNGDSGSESESVPEEGGLTAWLVVLACFLLSFNCLGVSYSFGVYQAHYFLYEFRNYSAEVISLIGATCLTATLGMSIFVGHWIEVYGVKIVALLGSIVFSGSLIAAGFCRSVPSLIITQGLLNGIGAGILYIPSVTAMIPWFIKKRSLALGFSGAGAGIGGIFYSFITRTIILKLSYQWALWITACTSAVLNCIAVVFIRSKKSTQARINGRGSFRDMFGALKDPKFLAIYIGSGLCVLGYFIPFFYVPTYAQTQLHTTPLVGSILVAIMDLGVSMGRILIGRMADSGIGTMNSIIISMAISGLCQLALWLPASNSLGLLYVFSFVYGFFGGSIGLLPVILARIFDAERLPSITGLFYSSELPGQMAGGPIAGVIFSKGNGNWSPVIIYSAMAMFWGSMLIFATRLQVERRIFVSV